MTHNEQKSHAHTFFVILVCRSVADALGLFFSEANVLPREMLKTIFFPRLFVNTELSLFDIRRRSPQSDDFGANSDVCHKFFKPVLEYLQTFVKIHGDVIEKNARSVIQSMTQNNAWQCWEQHQQAALALVPIRPIACIVHFLVGKGKRYVATDEYLVD